MKENNKVIIRGYEIPTEWNDITFKQYKRLGELDLLPEESGVDRLNNSVAMISLILNIPKKELENMTASDFIRIQECLQFLSTEIPKKGKVKWKFIPIREITMDKWIAYEKYSQNPEDNMSKILSLLQNEYSEEDINNMGVVEVLRGFFTLQRSSNLFIRRFQLSLSLKMMKWKMKSIWMNLLKRKGQYSRKSRGL